VQYIEKSDIYTFSRTLFFIFLFRASIDIPLEFTKIGGIGLGALINLFVFFITCCLISAQKFKVPQAAIRPFLIFIIFGLISILVSPIPIESARSFFSVITYVSVFIISYYYIYSGGKYEDCRNVIIYSSVVPFFFAFFEIFMIFINGEGRLYSTFSHPNIFAFYCVLIFSISMIDFVKKECDIRGRLLFVMFFSVFCLLMTQTRSAWLALFIVLLTYGIFANRKFLIYLFLMTSCLFFIPLVQDRVIDLFSGNDVNEVLQGEALNSYAWRKLVWNSSEDMIFQSPIFGHGYNTFSYYFEDFFPLPTDKNYDAHNTYVQVAFDMGLISVFAYLFIYYCVVNKMRQLLRFDKVKYSISMGLVFSYILVGYSDNMLFYLAYNWYFWFFVGVVYFDKNSEVMFEKYER
tara:strand:+ start:387 stop:1601 length:1215 start_codon:yes stop_codon:yes gene_type:complete